MRISTPFSHMRINMLYDTFPASKGLYVKLFSIYQNERNPFSRVSTYIINVISNLSSFFTRRLIRRNFSCVRCPCRVKLVPASLRTASPIWR